MSEEDHPSWARGVSIWARHPPRAPFVRATYEARLDAHAGLDAALERLVDDGHRQRGDDDETRSDESCGAARGGAGRPSQPFSTVGHDSPEARAVPASRALRARHRRLTQKGRKSYVDAPLVLRSMVGASGARGAARRRITHAGSHPDWLGCVRRLTSIFIAPGDAGRPQRHGWLGRYLHPYDETIKNRMLMGHYRARSPLSGKCWPPPFGPQAGCAHHTVSFVSERSLSRRARTDPWPGYEEAQVATAVVRPTPRRPPQGTIDTNPKRFRDYPVEPPVTHSAPLGASQLGCNERVPRVHVAATPARVTVYRTVPWQRSINSVPAEQPTAVCKVEPTDGPAQYSGLRAGVCFSEDGTVPAAVVHAEPASVLAAASESGSSGRLPPLALISQRAQPVRRGLGHPPDPARRIGDL